MFPYVPAGFIYICIAKCWLHHVCSGGDIGTDRHTLKLVWSVKNVFLILVLDPKDEASNTCEQYDSFLLASSQLFTLCCMRQTLCAL